MATVKKIALYCPETQRTLEYLKSQLKLRYPEAHVRVSKNSKEFRLFCDIEQTKDDEDFNTSATTLENDVAWYIHMRLSEQTAHA